MFGKARFLSASVLTVLCCGILLGCPSEKPDYQVVLLVEPTELDFGATETTLQFEVCKSWSSRPMSPLSLRTNQEWLEATADKTVSDGPDDPIVVSVTVDRLLMSAGDNEGVVTVVSEGTIHKKVKVTAKALLVSDFRTNTTFAYVGDPVNFLDESICPEGQGPILRWLWDFGDGQTSTQQNPVHAYANPGVYTVVLTVQTASASVEQEKEDYITVAGKQAPDAAFEASSRNVLVDQPIAFNDLSTAGTAPITQWLWNFGDGTSSTDPSPTHAYTVPGVYGVSLTVVSAHGSDTQLEQDYVVVGEVGPSADFVADARTPLVGRTVQFTDRSDDGTAPITSWFWEFGDGVTSVLQHPAHAFATAGSYTVRLTVVSAHGTSTEEKTNYIVARLSGPSADFTVSTQTPFDDEAVHFIDQSEPGTAPITGWLWEFGDGAISTLQNPTHAYSTAGVYSVTLIITTSHGTDAVTKINLITVTAKTGPTAALDASPRNPAINDLVQFSDQSIPGTAPITTWLWTFGDGGTSSLKNPTHTYTSTGTYTVTLTVTSAHGADSVEEQNFIAVQERQGPTASFLATPLSVFATDPVQFTDTSDLGTSPTTATWLWNFGDGGTSTLQNPTHGYATPGTYSVTLTVTTAHGTDSETQTDLITVNEIVAPTADFTTSSRNPETGQSVQFLDLSDSGTAEITNWLWDFGDGSTSDEQNPVHAYTEAGTYSVSLTVTSAHGTNTLLETNYIVVWASGGPRPPTALFTSDLTTVRLGDSVQFLDLSDPGTSPIDSWLWYFGDGGTSTLQHPTHTYAEVGEYTVRLTVVTADGADTEVQSKYITVGNDDVPPTADFDASNWSPLTGETVEFTDQSATGTAAITSWAWTFGDGDSATVKNPTHVYTGPVDPSAVYNVTLTITDSKDQTDSVMKQVTVWNPDDIKPPVADFDISDTAPSTAEDVAFWDQSEPGTAAITSWEWDFGDGHTSTLQNPMHAYSISKKYTVTLTVTTPHGQDVETKTDVVDVQGTIAPQADFSFSPLKPLINEDVTFTDDSTAGSAPITGRLWDFGDGASSTALNPTHSYALAGFYTVTLTVYSDHGNDTAEPKTVEVVSPTTPPTADFEADDTTPYLGQVVQFTDRSDRGGAAITDWVWDFGDGSGSTDQSPQHTYTVPGTYDVSLTVTTNIGQDEEIKTGYIVASAFEPKGPTADFTVSERNPKVNDTITFTDTSDPGDAPEITDRIWDFGDGTPTVHGSTAEHYYAGAAVYTVKLTIDTASYGSDTEEKKNYIGVSDAAAAAIKFTVNNTDKVGFTRDLTEDQIDFTGELAKQVSTWRWNFSDDSTATGATAQHAYTAPGMYSVALTAEMANGTVSSMVQDILIHQKTALDTYVRDTSNTPDPEWQYGGTENGVTYMAYHYLLSSQWWRAGDYTDIQSKTDGLWQHWLTFIVPGGLSSSTDTALLYITGGDNTTDFGTTPPTIATDEELQLLGMLANAIDAPVVLLRQVPNQPVWFVENPIRRTEDAIIAYTYDKYLDGGAHDWPLLIPMTKSAIEAMDAAQWFCSSALAPPLTIDNFVVTGASKRGWTTWLTAAVDTRVKAITPLVIDVLSMEEQMDHNYSAYGHYAEAVHDYYEDPQREVFQRFGTPLGQALLGLVDPYSYRDRLTMPKLGINATGDEFFLPDSAQYYYGDLLGEKHLRYMPNTNHSLTVGTTMLQTAYSVAGFYDAVVNETARPQMTWKVAAPGIMRVSVPSNSSLDSVGLWTATTTDGERDFRYDYGGPTWTYTELTATAPNLYETNVPEPASGQYTGYFVEARFTSPFSALYGSEADCVYTTEVRVVPDTMPFSPP